MPVIAVLPLDDRPVTYDLPARIGAIAGAEVRLPPRDALGNLTRPADREALGQWLLDTAPSADALVIAIDTLAYGGLVPSRRSADSLADLMHRLAPLRTLKAREPALAIHAFNVTMRLSDSNVNEEEKPYWDLYGKIIYRWSFHQHRFKAHNDPEDQAIAREARAAIPRDVVDDYLDTRQRNFALNETMVRWAGADFFATLALTQDDTSPFGLNVEEQQQLQTMITTTQIADRALIYPGADEVASVLLARALNQQARRKPLIAVSWHPLDGKRVQAMYEDRPLWRTLRGQIEAAGCKEVTDEASADVLVVVNAPGPAGQGDLAQGLHLERPDTPPRNLEPLLLTLEGATRPVAFADVAYANGADPRLMPELVRRIDPFQAFLAYAAWNTAGNSFGTLVAMASCATLPDANPAARERLLAERLADDWLYQSVIRPELQRQRAAGSDIEALKRELDRQLAAAWAANFPQHPATFEAYFPWDRLFEAGLSRVGESAPG